MCYKKAPMKRFFFLLILCLAGLSPLGFAQSQLVDQVVAVVNDEVITQSELDMILRPLYMQYKSQYPEDKLVQMMNDARQKLLNQLIEDKLVYQEAQKQKIDVDESMLDSEIEDLKKRFSTDQELEDALHQDGLNFKEMRERLRRQNMIRQLQDREVRSRIVVSPLDVERYYQEHSDEFAANESVRVRSITIRKNEEAIQKGLKDEAAKLKIEKVRKEIAGGAKFDEMAKRMSEDTQAKNGGLGDWTEPGMMIPVIDAVIFKLQMGEMSEIIESPMGYHLFRMEEKRKKYKKNFPEVREQIYDKLFRQKSQERFQEWMKELRRDAYISVQ